MQPQHLTARSVLRAARSSRRSSRALAVIAVGAAVALMTGCTAPAGTPSVAPTSAEVAPGFLAVADESAAAGGTLDIQLDYDTDEAGGLDPQTAAAARSWAIESLVYQTLVNVDETMTPTPGLATSWSTPSDTEYVFELDPEATFSNGRAMTAADVVGSIERLLASTGVWASQLGPVQTVEATGEHEVTITLATPYTPFLAALANTPAAVLPIEEIDAGTVDLATTMLGTGPLVVTDHRQDEYWTFGINEHFPGASDLGFSDVRIDIVAEETTRIAGLKDGTADLAVFNSVDSIDALASTSSATVVTQKNTDYFYLMINSKSSTTALADEKVRFAINSAIDREQINQLAFGGWSAATGAAPSALPGSCAADDLPSADARSGSDADGIAEAKAVIDEAGGLEVNLLVYTSEPVLAQIAQVVQQNLAEIGVTVTIEQYDYGTYADHVYTASPGDFDMALSWFAGYADPSMVTGWWNPGEAVFSQGFMSGSDELNSLIDTARTTVAGDERDSTISDLCAAADEESEMVPLVLRPSVVGYANETLSPTLASVEGYGNVLRDITSYRAE